jgi:hypothetical protein
MNDFPSANDMRKEQFDRKETILRNTLEFIKKNLEKTFRTSVFVNYIDETINIEIFVEVKEYLIKQGYSVRIINDEGLKRNTYDVRISWEEKTSK